jgi:hypothetical protein
MHPRILSAVPNVVDHAKADPELGAQDRSPVMRSRLDDRDLVVVQAPPIMPVDVAE